MDLLETLKKIAKDGLPFRLDVIDDSKGSGVEEEEAYLDLVDTDNHDAPYRLILQGPEAL